MSDASGGDPDFFPPEQRILTCSLPQRTGVGSPLGGMVLRIDNYSAKENESWVGVVTPRLLQLPPHCRACHPLILCIVGSNRVKLVLLDRLYCIKTS